MTFRADFNLELDVRGFTIEADSPEEAKQKLIHMFPMEICEQLTVNDEDLIHNSAVEDIDLECTDKTIDVEVSNIKYVDDDGNEYFPAESKYSLTSLEVHDGDDIEDLIKDEVSYLADVDEDNVYSFDYKVIKEY